MNENSETSAGRKDRERQRHRREVLEAAERIFALKGYDATTVEEIAKEAQFAVGTLYNLFKNKEEIYGQVIEGIVRNFVDCFEQQVLSLDDPVKAIESLIAIRLSHVHRHRAFIRIVFEASVGALGKRCPPEIAQLHERYMEAVRAIFQQGLSRGVFIGSDPLYLSLSLEGTISAFVAYWSKNQPEWPLDEQVRMMQREFVGRIRACA